MIGYIRCACGKGRVSTVVENLYGVQVMTAVLYVADGERAQRTERKLTWLSRKFQKNSISRIIVAPDFPYCERLRNFKMVDGLDFYRAVADVLAFGWLETHGFVVAQSCVSLAGTRLSPELEYTARRLCYYVRGICIEVPGVEAELFAAELQRDFGIPVMPRGIRSDLTIEFGSTEKGGQLRLWGEQPYLDGLQLCAEGIDLPKELRLPILSLLWEKGYLQRQKLQILVSKGEKSC